MNWVTLCIKALLSLFHSFTTCKHQAPPILPSRPSFRNMSSCSIITSIALALHSTEIQSQLYIRILRALPKLLQNFWKIRIPTIPIFNKFLKWHFFSVNISPHVEHMLPHARYILVFPDFWKTRLHHHHHDRETNLRKWNEISIFWTNTWSSEMAACI